MLRHLGKLPLEAFHGAALGKLIRHANSIEDRAIVRRAVPDDAHPAHAQQRRAAVLPVIQPAPEVVKGLPREQRAHLRRHRPRQRLAQHVAHKAAHALAGLQRHVAHKAVAHNHVGLAR